MLNSSLPLIPTQIIAKYFGLADSGATGHFFTTNAHVVNKQIALNPLNVKIPDGNTLQSSHTCELDLPKLPGVDLGSEEAAAERELVLQVAELRGAFLRLAADVFGGMVRVV
jgi:hypothetical protein